MPTYEVFLKNDGRDEYRHAGSLEAATDELATVLARECYVRRSEGDRIWLVERSNVIEPDMDFLDLDVSDGHRYQSEEAAAARRRAAKAGVAGTANSVSVDETRD